MRSKIDTERGVPPPPEQRIQKPAQDKAVALRRLRNTLHGIGYVSQEMLQVAESNRRREEAERHLLEREFQIENAINEAQRPTKPGALVTRLKEIAPGLDDTDILIIALHHTTLEKVPSLKQKFLTGGKDITNKEGVKARLFDLETIGQGGLGVVKNSYIFVGYRLINAASKRPIQAPQPDLSHTNYEAIIKHNRHLRDCYLNETRNAETTSKLKLAHIVHAIFISTATDTELPIVVYEKITNPYGQIESLRDLIQDPNISPSQAIMAISYAGDGLHEAHQAGLIHYDFKPENIMIDSKGQGTNIDLGSMHSVNDTIIFQTDDYGTFTYKVTTEKGKKHHQYLATTKKYYDDALAQKLQQEGKTATINDRVAYGKCLKKILIAKQLVGINTESADVLEEAFIKRILNLTDAEFPSASLKKLWCIIQELQDTKRMPIRPLNEINREIREIAHTMQEETDPFFKKMIALLKQNEYNNRYLKQAYANK